MKRKEREKEKEMETEREERGWRRVTPKRRRSNRQAMQNPFLSP